MIYDDIVKKLETKVSKLSYIHQISHGINSITDEKKILTYLLDHALIALEATQGSIYIYPDNENDLHLVKAKKRIIDFVPMPLREQNTSHAIAMRVAEKGEPILVADVSDSPDFKKYVPEAIGSFICTPLKTKERCVGVIFIANSLRGEQLGNDDLEFLFILANHASIAMDNIRMLEKVKTLNCKLEHGIDTVSRQLQAIMHESELLRKYKESILESLSTGIYVVDKDLRVTLWNRGMESHYAISREYALGKKISEVGLSYHDTKKLYQAIERVMSTGSAIILEKNKYFLKKAGQPYVYRLINCTIFPLCTEKENESSGVVVLHEDITEKVALEKEVRVNERLALIGKMSSGIAHELNNPLDGTRRFINLSLEKIKQTSCHENHNAQKYLHLANEGVNRMINIVHSLLEFSRKTKIVENNQRMPVTAILTEAVTALETHACFTAIHIIKKIKESHTGVFIDSNIQTVVTNILSNALDAMPEGGTLLIETHISESNESTLEIRIEDTGKGITLEDQSHIFDPFFTTKESSSGTGLGLALCQEIMKRLNGTIVFESTVGVGTAFVIHVPIWNHTVQNKGVHV